MQDQDLWDMPGQCSGVPGGGGGSAQQFDLPEFFRTSGAPPFLDHVLEDEAKAAAAHGRKGAGRRDLGPMAKGGAGGWPQQAAEAEDEEEDDEVVFHSQLLG